MLQSPGAPFPIGSPMLPDLSNMRYMSTGAKQFPPLDPLAPEVPPDAPLLPGMKPPLLEGSPLAPPLAPLEPNVESEEDPHATASANAQVAIVTTRERRTGAAMLIEYPASDMKAGSLEHSAPVWGHTRLHGSRTDQALECAWAPTHRADASSGMLSTRAQAGRH